MNRLPDFDREGLNILDPADRLGAKSRYITLVQERALLRYLPAPDGNRVAVDLGCGYGRLTGAIVRKGWSVIGVDPDRTLLRFVSDAHHMEDIGDGAYDTVMAMSVLEHLSRPWVGLAEMRRVCRPGGAIVLEVPHLSRLHEEPHDYFRFTQFGLRRLAEEAGLEVVMIESAGGLLAFLGHQLSTVIVCASWGVPLLKWIAFWMNYALVVRASVLLDRLLRTERVFPMGLVGVFRRPAGS